MSDIIDSLKRLERAGSENSTTTQKLIAAAHELSNLIVEQFAVIGSEGVPVVSLYSKTVYDDNEERFRQVGPDFRYGHYVQVKKLGTVAALLGGTGALFALAQAGPTRRWLLARGIQAD